MLRTLLIAAATSLAFTLVARLFMWARKQEIDSNGRPMLRFVAAPYLMFACALAFLAIAIYQWLDPVNHRYAGNLMLSYIPAAIGIIALCVAIYFLTYRAALTPTAIEIYRWPFGRKTYRLRDLERIETREAGTTIHFKGQGRYTVYHHYSGGAHFLSALSANNSFKPNPHQPGA